MCRVDKLIEYLQTLPPETEVNVLEIGSSGYEMTHKWVPLELGEYSDTCDFIDLTNNPFVKDDDPRKNSKSLDLGST